MKILYVTQTFSPEPLSVERSVKQMIQLQRLGHSVTVLTTMPSFPFGKIYKQYRGKLFARETIEGMSLVRVWSLPAANRHVLRRMMSFFSFAISAMVAGICLARHDLVIANVPHPGTELAAIGIARLKGTDVLLEMVDLIPDNLRFIGVPSTSVMSRALAAYYRVVYRLVDLISVLCQSAAEVLVDYGVPRERIILWPNASDLDLLTSSNSAMVRKRHSLDGKFVVLYAGSFSRYYQVETIVAAAKLLEDKLPEVHFMLLGAGSQWEAVRQSIERNSQRNVDLPGVVPRSELGSYLQAADLFIFSMVGNPTPRPYHNILTAKACDYLLAGRPIISVEDGAILSELLEKISAGVTVRPESPQLLGDAIRIFVNDENYRIKCGRAGQAYAKKNLMRYKVTQRFDSQLRTKLQIRWSSNC